MKHIQKCISIIFIFILAFCTVFHSYKEVGSGTIVYADTNNWQNCNTTEMQAKAFMAYCKSRDLTIEGSLADGLTSYTTSTYQKLLNSIGVDMNTIQSDIKYAADSNNGLQFLLTTNGASVFNRLFSQFLQDNELSVGDEDVNKPVYSGRWFVDADGNGCLISVKGTSGSSSTIEAIGTPYKFTHDEILSLVGQSSYTLNFHTTDTQTINQTVTYNSRKPASDSTEVSVGFNGYVTGTMYYHTFNRTDGYKLYEWGYPTIILNNNNLYLGIYSERQIRNGTPEPALYTNTQIVNKVANDYEPVTVTIVSVQINDNDYSENTYTTINNEGDVNNYDTDDEPTPSTPPDGGGGGDTPSNPSPPNWDIDLPEMPNDWLLYGLEKKFPFDIPFNMMFALSLLNAEPQAPRLQGDIDLKLYTWHYDINLEQFEPVAVICRRLMLLLFIIGLMVMTHELIRW